MYALVDCNSFYASCEKLFRPDLRNIPVVVLSNNDGCVIARCALAKKIVKMGIPYFQCKDLLEKSGCVVFSSNYTLYQDISNRVMTTLESLSPDCEIYSIDEAWLDLTGYTTALIGLDAYANQVKQTVYKNVGVPVGVGIAPTKTLAKLANHYAKQQGGICVIDNHDYRTQLLAQTDIADIWGIGRQLTKRLNILGIKTALDLANYPIKPLAKQTSVLTERTALELNGIRCYGLDATEPKKEIVCSRSFGQRITDKTQIIEAVVLYTTRACEKLRNQQSLAKRITVFIRTGQFNHNGKQRSVSLSSELIHPSDDSRLFIKMATLLVDKLWLDGYRYAKAGVMLTDFYSHKPYQDDLFENRAAYDIEKSHRLMQALDTINRQFGAHTLKFASEGTTKTWQMSRDMLSPCYTTNVKQLPKVH